MFTHNFSKLQFYFLWRWIISPILWVVCMIIKFVKHLTRSFCVLHVAYYYLFSSGDKVSLDCVCSWLCHLRKRNGQAEAEIIMIYTKKQPWLTLGYGINYDNIIFFKFLFIFQGFWKFIYFTIRKKIIFKNKLGTVCVLGSMLDEIVINYIWGTLFMCCSSKWRKRRVHKLFQGWQAS